MMRISCLVNLVCRHKSSRATGLACWNADGLLSCSSSSISVASSMIGLSGGVAIARWPPNRSPLLPLLSLHAIVGVAARVRGPTVYDRAPVFPARHHCPRFPASGLRVRRSGGRWFSVAAATATARLLFYCSIQTPSGRSPRKKIMVIRISVRDFIIRIRAIQLKT